MLSTIVSIARTPLAPCNITTLGRINKSQLPIKRCTITMSAKSALEEMEKGAFIRTDATLRHQISKGSEFEPESGRYHLYISYACPWANRCLAVVNLKGLEDHIGLSVTHPTWAATRPGKDNHHGWQFKSPDDPPVANATGHGSFPCTACIPDAINGSAFVRDLYELGGVDPGKYTVPVLWDKYTKKVVNNESSDIIRILNSAFNDIAKHPDLDLYPEDLRAEIDAVNEWVYASINNGVYRCGFAQAQAAYEMAFNELFAALDRVEGILAKQRYLAGDRFTEADVRLFMTLIRFDPVYIVYFKCNKKAIREYPNMREYVKELYAMPALGSSVNMYHIKTHYFTSHPALNTYAIVPLGCDDWWKEPHNRDETHPLK